MSSFVQGRFDILPPPITVLRFPVIKDAFTSSLVPTLNYGDTFDLLTGPLYETFFSFDLSALPDQEFLYTRLVLTAPRAIAPLETPLEIHKVSPDQHWTETGITHANRPKETELLYALFPEGTRIEVDLDGVFEEEYALKSEAVYRFSSKESGNGPYIEVAFLDPETLRETEARYFPLGYTAQLWKDSNFKIEWEGVLPYGESSFGLNYTLSNQFLLEYAADPKFTLLYVGQKTEEVPFVLGFGARGRSTSDLALSFTAVGQDEDLLSLRFLGVVHTEWSVSYEAMPTVDFAIAFGVQDEDCNDFKLEYSPAYGSNFGLEFRATADGERDFELSFGVQDEDDADLKLDYVLMFRSEFGLEFQARQNDNQDFALSFGVQDEDVENFLLEFDVISEVYFPLEFGARASSEDGVQLEYTIQTRTESNFALTWFGRSVQDLALDFQVQAPEDREILLEYDALRRYMGDLPIDYTAQTRLKADLPIQYEALPFSDFSVHFGAQVHDGKELPLEFVAQMVIEDDMPIHFQAALLSDFALHFEPVMVGESLFHIRFEAEPKRKRRPKVVDSGPDVGVYVFSERK